MNDLNSASELGQIIAAWEDRQLPRLLASIRERTDLLFDEATDEQRAGYLQRRHAHTERIIEIIREGASDAAIIGEATAFYQDNLRAPRKAPSPPTPESEMERIAKAMCDPATPFPPAYNGCEMDSIAELLRRKPGARVTGWNKRTVLIDSEPIARRDLRDVCFPTYGIESKRSVWHKQFPDPVSYERDEPRPEDYPTVTRE